MKEIDDVFDFEQFKSNWIDSMKRKDGIYMSVPDISYDKEYNPLPGELDKIAIKGKVKFIREHGHVENFQKFESNIIENPTWKDLLDIANDMTLAAMDFDHVFLEGFRKVNTIDGVDIYKFFMGS